jgi:hypothetical protein
MEKQMNESKFIGTWKLLSLESRTEDGQVAYPLGKDVIGGITYTEQKFMSVSIMQPNRPLFASGDIRGGTVEEKVAAIDGYVSYNGRFSVNDKTIVHHIELSLFPNWIGIDQERYFEFKANTLTLSTPPFLLEGKNSTAHLVWRKVEQT